MRNTIRGLHAKSFALAVAFASLSPSAPSMAAPGDPLGAEFRVNTFTTGSQGSPAVARSANGDFVVAFEDRSSANAGIYYRRYKADGTAKDSSPVRVVAKGTSGRLPTAPDVAMNSAGNFVVMWLDPNADALFAQRHSAGGTAQGTAIQAATASQAKTIKHDPNQDVESPSIAMDDQGNFAVAYSEFKDADGAEECTSSGRTFVVQFSANGAGRGTTQVADNTDDTCTFSPIIAMEPDGEFVVAFHTLRVSDSDDTKAQSYLRARRFLASGATHTIPIEDHIYAVDRRSSLNGIAVNADGDFVVTWSEYGKDDSDFETASVRMRRYDSTSGTPSDPQDVAVAGAHDHRDSAIGMASDGSFTIVWERFNHPGETSSEVMRRSFNSSGNPVSGPVRVNTFATHVQDDPVIAVNPNGSFVVVWESANQDRSGDGVYAQRHEGLPSSSAPTVRFALASSNAQEVAVTLKLSVLLSSTTTRDVTVPINVGGTATLGQDYRLPVRNILVPAGQTSAKFRIVVLNETRTEPNETVILTMGVPTNARLGTTPSHQLTILAND